MGSVGELVHAGDRAAATNELVEVVAGIVGPGRVERRHGPTHGETGELDEGVVEGERAAGNAVIAEAVDRGQTRSVRGTGAVEGRTVASAAIGARAVGEVAIEEGADDTVFGRG